MRFTTGLQFNFSRTLVRGLACALVAGSVFLAESRATIVAYNGFGDPSGLSLQGDASIVTSNGVQVLRLVGAQESQSGTVFGATKLNSATFSTAFQFQMTNAGGINDETGEVGGDGFTFLVQNQAVNAVGEFGGALGIGGITPSIAVEFDTYSNSEISSNHVGIDVNGDTDSVASVDIETVFGSGTRLDSTASTGLIWTAWIDYDGTNFELRLSNNGVRPTSALLTHSIDLLATLGSPTTFVGFTGSTGQAYANTDILNWAYSDVFVPGGVSVVPEPSTWALLATGLAALGVTYYRRRR